MLLPNQGSVMLCPLSKEGILYLGNLKLAVSVSWLLSGGQNSHILFFFFFGPWEASVSPSGQGKTVLPLCSRQGGGSGCPNPAAADQGA